MARTEKENKAISDAMTKARTTLVQNHRAEYNRLVEKNAKAVGVQWSPRPSAADRAAAQIAALIEQNPELKHRFQEVSGDEPTDVEVVEVVDGE